MEVQVKVQKLFDSEFKIMEIIWESEPISARQVSLIASDQIGWNKNTTYTVIKKLESKGYIKREEPGFICSSLISREDVCKTEARSLVDKLFGGSKKALFSALLEDEKLSPSDLDELRKMIEKR
jgi:BlaI family penicillinase repressor